MRTSSYDNGDDVYSGIKMPAMDREAFDSGARIKDQISHLRDQVLKTREVMGMLIERIDPILIPLSNFNGSGAILDGPTPGGLPKNSELSDDLDQIAGLVSEMQRSMMFTLSERVQL